MTTYRSTEIERTDDYARVDLLVDGHLTLKEAIFSDAHNHVARNIQDVDTYEEYALDGTVIIMSGEAFLEGIRKDKEFDQAHK